jgi:hypothetical protein
MPFFADRDGLRVIRAPENHAGSGRRWTGFFGAATKTPADGKQNIAEIEQSIRYFNPGGSLNRNCSLVGRGRLPTMP